jgi:transposase-like protein
MRYSASEKFEIIELVEHSSLSIPRTLAPIGIPRSTFYDWYSRYQEGGIEALEDGKPIAELRADIARERVVIEHALAAGYPSVVAESMLHALEGALRIFEKHRSLILDELERQPSE